MIIIDDIIQGDDAWFREKAGKPSASNFSKLLGTKGNPSASAPGYMYRLAGEAIVGRCEETYKSGPMAEGTYREAESRTFFELVQGVDVRQVGMVYKDESRSVLCSPDGLMDESGLELKNPLMGTHVKYLMAGKLPTDYFCQVQGSMYVTGFKTWIFMSYFPGIAPFILEVKRDEAWISKLAKELDRFTMDLALMIRRLREL